MCAIASHNELLRISIDPHPLNKNKRVKVNKFESTPVFSSNSGLNLASSYLHEGSENAEQKAQRLPNQTHSRKKSLDFFTVRQVTHHLSRSTCSQLHILPQSLEIWESFAKFTEQFFRQRNFGLRPWCPKAKIESEVSFFKKNKINVELYSNVVFTPFPRSF